MAAVLAMTDRPTIVLGSGNKDKARELQRLIKDLRIKVALIGEFGKIPRVVEDGRTFAANACKKARAYSKRNPHITLADDSGLCVHALNGKPGVYSARYAGPGCSYEDNNRKLLKALGDRPASRRKAKMVSVVALYRNGKKLGMVKGECYGRITTEIRGKHGFGYDPVFVPNGRSQTFAEMTPAQKNAVSHRSRALTQAKKLLRKLI